MGLFRPYERTERKPDAEVRSSSRLSSLTPTKSELAAETATGTEPAASPTTSPATTGKAKRVPRKKEGATRTREQAEAERMERLHPTRSPREQRKADRQARMQHRLDAFDRMEASPERRLARDWVDSRWTINEFMLPAMLLIMAAVMVTMPWPLLSTYIGLGLWVLMLGTIINFVILWKGFRRLLDQRMPNLGLQGKGLRMYMFNRALMIRRFRRPPAEIKRGDPIR